MRASPSSATPGVQGADAEPSLVAALRSVAAAGVDVLCLVRGGGARTDLAAFDGDTLARAIAALAYRC